MTDVIFDVLGIPAPQGSKSAFYSPAIGRAVIVEGKSGQRERHKTWREGVAQACRDWLKEHPQAPFDEPLSVEVEFRFPLPKSDAYRTFHVGPPDIDKLLRSTFDALVFGTLIRDDSIIASVSARKRYAREPLSPGATIEVWPMGEVEARTRESLKEAAKAARADQRHAVG